MPLFSQLVAGLFQVLGAFFGRYLSAQVALRLAAVTSFVALGGALVAAWRAVVVPWVAALFATSYGQWLGLAFPPVAGSVMVGCAAVWLACTAYRLQSSALRLMVGS